MIVPFILLDFCSSSRYVCIRGAALLLTTSHYKSSLISRVSTSHLLPPALHSYSQLLQGGKVGF